MLSTGSPNKFFDGLAARKLIITNFGGWISDLISTYRCGFEYDPEDPDTFMQKLKPYLDDSNKLESAREEAFKLASQFEPGRQLHKLSTLLKNFEGKK